MSTRGAGGRNRLERRPRAPASELPGYGYVVDVVTWLAEVVTLRDVRARRIERTAPTAPVQRVCPAMRDTLTEAAGCSLPRR